MSSKSKWSGIGYSTWQQLTAEGYTTWRHLYLTLISSAGNIVFSFVSVFSQRIIELLTEGSVIFDFYSALSRPINIVAEDNFVFDFIPEVYRVCEVTSERSIIFSSVPKVFRIAKIASEADIIFDCASYINRIISLLALRPRFSWNEISRYTWKRLTDENYIIWRSLYNRRLIFVGISDIEGEITYFARGLIKFIGISALCVNRHPMSEGEMLFKTAADLLREGKEGWKELFKIIPYWAEKPREIYQWLETEKKDSDWRKQHRSAVVWTEENRNDNVWEEK